MRYTRRCLTIVLALAVAVAADTALAACSDQTPPGSAVEPGNNVSFHPGGDAPRAGLIFLRTMGDARAPDSSRPLPEATIQWLTTHDTALVAAAVCDTASVSVGAVVARALAAITTRSPSLAGGGRIFLAAADNGAHRVAQWLAADDIDSAAAAVRDEIAGVLLLGGHYTFAPKPRSQLPPLLILGAETQPRAWGISQRIFAERLFALGHDARFHVIPGAGSEALLDWHTPTSGAGRLAKDFLGVTPAPTRLAELIRLEKIWRTPPFNTDSFWRYRKIIKRYAADDRFRGTVARVYGNDRYRLAAWKLGQFHAIPLTDYLAARFSQPTGQFLITTNLRGEKYYWPLAEALSYEPVIVIGVDEEQNPFRMTVFYQAKRESSWRAQAAPPPVMARSLGAFLFFRRPPPAHLNPPFGAQFALTEASLALTDSDPLAEIRRLDKDVFAALTHANGCLSCHAWRGVGGRAHHLRADTGKTHGGYGLPLADYPRRVWRRFLFDQAAVAAEIGATANPVPAATSRKLFSLVINPELPDGG